MQIGGTIRNIKRVNIGDSHFPVIFTHVGVANDSMDIDSLIEVEKEKISRAIQAGADVICDVSMSQNMNYVHEKLMADCPVPFGTVTIYEAYIKSKVKDLRMDAKELIEVFEDQVLRGFDIITLHATVFRSDVDLIKESSRIIPTTSRGGMLLLELLKHNEYENPFYTYFDEILDIASKHSVCISLGPCFRPGSVYDCRMDDELHFMEIRRMAELVKKAQDRNVGITIEGIGHAPINRAPEIIKKTKEICHNAPYRVMTVATDIAIGFDHIASAIGSAVAIYNGADSITCVTRSEHIGVPNIDEIEEAVIAARVAAHCGYSARIDNFEQDYKMSIAREKQGCIGNVTSALFPNKVMEILNKRGVEKTDKSCTMCGEYCPLNSLDR